MRASAASCALATSSDICLSKGRAVLAQQSAVHTKDPRVPCSTSMKGRPRYQEPARKATSMRSCAPPDWANTSSDAVRLQSKWSPPPTSRSLPRRSAASLQSRWLPQGHCRGPDTHHVCDFARCHHRRTTARGVRDRSCVCTAQCPLALTGLRAANATSPQPRTGRLVDRAANPWFSVGSTTSSMHFDCYSNVLLVVRASSGSSSCPQLWAERCALVRRMGHLPTTRPFPPVLAVSALGASAMRMT